MDLPDPQSKGQQSGSWGLWATIGLSCLILLAYFFCGTLVTAGFIGSSPTPDIKPDVDQLMSNGLLVTLIILISSPFTVALTLLLVKLRKGMSPKQYIGLHEIHWRDILKWCFALLLLAAASDLLDVLLGRPIVQSFMLNIYLTAPDKLLLWIAIIIAAPVSEEFFFRGFLFTGILHSKLGPWGAVILSSLAWAPLHNQYDPYGMATVMVLGLLFGLARLKTDSVYTTIGMHALTNFVAAMEVMVHLSRS